MSGEIAASKFSLDDHRWHSPDAIRRLVREILAFEIAASTKRRPSEGVVASWGDAAVIDEDGLGFDSLSRLDAASHVTQFFHLGEVGYEDYLLIRRTIGDWVSIVERSLDVKSEHLTFRTSGSTGAPKCCTHKIAALGAEAVEFSGIIGPRSRVVGLVPPLHLYGFIFTVILPHVSGTPFFDARPSVLGLKDEVSPGDVVIGTPFHWAIVDKVVDRFPDDVVAVSSTGPLPGDLADRLRAKGLSRILEIYGSSETSGLGWREASGEPYLLLPAWERCDAGVRCIEPQGCADAVPLPDDVIWYGDRRLLPQARKDGAVKIGGINVFPARVASELSKHPAVAECVVRRTDGHDGTVRLEALIVPAASVDNEDGLVQELSQFAAASLDVPERPARFIFVAELPRSAMGKVSAA